MVGNVANFLSEEERDGGHGVLNVDAVSFELLDAFGDELVIMYKRPQISNKRRKQREQRDHEQDE